VLPLEDTDPKADQWHGHPGALFQGEAVTRERIVVQPWDRTTAPGGRIPDPPA